MESLVYKELARRRAAVKVVNLSWDPSAHPRAAAGEAGGIGGQFVPVGAARSEAAKKDQQDPEANELYKQLQGAKDVNAFMAGLKPDQLGKLTKLLYSFKTSDKKLVAARMAANSLLSKAGKNPADFGYLGGKPSAALSKAAGAAKAAPARGTAGKGAVDANAISDAELTRLKRAGWKGDPTDKSETLYSPAEMKKRQATKRKSAHATVAQSMAAKGK